MEQPAQSAEPASGAVTGQMTYAAPTYQPAGVVTGVPPPMGVMPAPSHPQSNFPANHELARQHQLAYQQFQQQQQQQQQQQLRAFWSNQMIEIEQTADFKNHSLPLARIKKIMKADEDVRMISAEAPVIFAKACEIFILELTLRSWIHTEENKRRTLQKNDIAAAISRTDIFDFLVDIVPRDEPREEGLGIPRAAMPTDPTHYYHIPSQHQVVPPGMIMGNHVDPTAAAAMVGGQHPGPMAYMWQQNQMQGPLPPQQLPPPPQQQQQMPDSD